MPFTESVHAARKACCWKADATHTLADKDALSIDLHGVDRLKVRRHTSHDHNISLGYSKEFSRIDCEDFAGIIQETDNGLRSVFQLPFAEWAIFRMLRIAPGMRCIWQL